MSESAIRISNISKAFGKTRALSDVSFEVPERTVYGLLGPNGAGKTTLFSIISDFLKADQGSINVLGHEVDKISELQGRMTILPQDAAFQSNIPIIDQLAFFRMLNGRPKAEAKDDVLEALDLVGLRTHARRGIKTLSHGMQKRVGIAQAFLGQPEVILLDEPTAGLDPANARQIRDLIKNIQASATIMISSHNMDEIQELCSHVAILDHGKVVTAGPVSDLTKSGREVEMELHRQLSDEDLAALNAVGGLASIHQRAGSAYDVNFSVPESSTWEKVTEDFLRAMLDRHIVPKRWIEGRSLEKEFLKITGNS